MGRLKKFLIWQDSYSASESAINVLKWTLPLIRMEGGGEGGKKDPFWNYDLILWLLVNTVVLNKVTKSVLSKKSYAAVKIIKYINHT